MRDTNPQRIKPEEWLEITGLREVREAWGLDEGIRPEEFAAAVYGVKFDFVSGCPGYVGDLYLLQGDAITEAGAMVLIRDAHGKLALANSTVATFA